jgi:hypothetical protein
VTAELERRWEPALRELKEAEERLQREQQQPRVPEALSHAAETIPEETFGRPSQPGPEA